MKVEGKNYRALWFEKDSVKFIDQRRLPYSFEIYSAKTVDDVAFAIKDMVVRGAPSIGAAAAYGMALGKKDLEKSAGKLRQMRPTAYDVFYAVDYMLSEINNGKKPLDAANDYVEDIVDRCRRIGENGEKLIKKGMKVLTHCNAGALATVDYGSALAPIRMAHRTGKKILWVIQIRLYRKLFTELLEKGLITRNTYTLLRKKSKGGLFRSRRHVLLFLNENNLWVKKK